MKLVNRELLTAIKKAGCIYMGLGIESGCDEVLLRMKKGFNKSDALRDIKLIASFGIKVNTYYMIGMADETEPEMDETKEFIKAVDERFSISFTTPYPGAPIYEEAKNRGLLPSNIEDLFLNYDEFSSKIAVNLSKVQTDRLYIKYDEIINDINKATYKNPITNIINIHRQYIKLYGVLNYFYEFSRMRRILNFIRYLNNYGLKKTYQKFLARIKGEDLFDLKYNV